MGIPGEDPRPNPPAHVMRVVAAGDYGSTRFANTFWVRNPAANIPDQVGFGDMVHYIATQWASRMSPFCSTNVIWNTADGLYYGPTGADLGATRAFSDFGNGSGAGLPANNSVCIGWSVQQHYRGGHPRSYLPGVLQGQLQDEASWLATYTDSIAQAANDFRDDVQNASYGGLSDLRLGVVSFVLRGEWREPPVFRDYVDGGASVDTRVDSQRRRLGPDR